MTTLLEAEARKRARLARQAAMDARQALLACPLSGEYAFETEVGSGQPKGAGYEIENELRGAMLELAAALDGLSRGARHCGHKNTMTERTRLALGYHHEQKGRK